ncbi:MAG: SAM-dependent methyltransferase, partial [Bacteroidaceae bacterium]|nr:SAM-dependent methyltransferase [Bacteroidaceae bacterium]
MMTENSILPKDCDPMGQAILDYQTTGKASTLKVLSTMFDDDEMSVPYLFRTEESFPVLERVALGLASGRVLDVGAGAGCHAIALQNKGLDVTAIDVSPLSCEAMRLRGLKNVQCVNFFS